MCYDYDFREILSSKAIKMKLSNIYIPFALIILSGTQCNLADVNCEVRRLEQCVNNLNDELIERNRELYELRNDNQSLKDALLKKQFNFDKIKDNDADMNFFTGLSCAALTFFWWEAYG